MLFSALAVRWWWLITPSEKSKAASAEFVQGSGNDVTPSMHRRFFGGAMLMMLGTAIGQAIPIAVSPVLTRIYSPEQFGALATFVGIATVLGVVATLRLEPAIVLPTDDREAANIAAVALTTAIVISSVILVLVLLGSDWITGRWPDAVSGAWLPLLAPMILCLAVAQTAASWVNRKRGYGRLASGSVLQQGGTATCSLALGLAGAMRSGLVVGRFCGQLLVTGWLLNAVFDDWRKGRQFVSLPRMKSAMSKHRQFPQYNLPYSLVGTASREFLVFALTFFHLTQSAGFYALARSVLYAPVSFLSASLSQVFYREAAESIGSPELERLAERLIRAIVIQFTPAFVALTVWGPELFELVFGTQWREAGTYAAIFAPAAYLFLFSSWPERLFEVTGRQRLSLTIQLIFDMLTVFAMMLLLARGYGPIAALVAFTAIACVYHCTYVTAAFRIAQFSSAVLWRAAVLAVALAIMAAFAFLACGQLDKAAGLAAAVGMTAFYSVGSFIWLLSKHRGRSESLPQESGE